MVYFQALEVDGNLLEYQYFVSMFNQVVEKKVSDQMGRLTRLLKFTGGEAKELIKYCIHFPPETVYETAVRLLNNRYGNPHHLLASYRKEIKAFPSVKPCDASGFRKFYSFVLKCEAFSKSTAWNALETQETLCILVSKLPRSLRDRWNRKVQVVRRSFGREPCLSDFASFVHDETTGVNDPIFSKDAVLEYVQTPKKKHDKNKKYGSFATKEGEVVKCSLYEGNHDLDDCNSFLQFDLQERSGCFITNCVMVVLVQFMSIVMLGITRTKRNAKFVRKDTQPLCMIIKQRKVKLSSRMATLQKNQK